MKYNIYQAWTVFQPLTLTATSIWVAMSEEQLGAVRLLQVYRQWLTVEDRRWSVQTETDGGGRPAEVLEEAAE